MSHLQERTEKNCLNCNAEVNGRFCHICGQENIEAKESVLHLVNHYFQDITHFDGKFFSTLKHLVARPGFLSAEYIRGRRASYLNPIRMYVFTSAIFFLLFFILMKPGIKEKPDLEPATAAQVIEKINEKIEATKAIGEVARDSVKIKKVAARIRRYEAQLELVRRDSVAGIQSYRESKDSDGFITFADEEYRSVAGYDSMQRLLPDAKRDNFFKRKLIRKSLEVKTKYKGNSGSLEEKLMENFMHKFPQILFISLPLFALLLKLLYFRRKSFFYTDHVIFTIHLYIFTFLVMLSVLLIQHLEDATNWKVLDIPIVILNLLVLFYQYKAMKNFYQQGRLKTLLKFFIVNVLALFIIAVLFIVFFLFSFFQT